nr:immunoglobulin heavy chain junction region [Macaca mulatta]MOX96394.1 immunoglobulin heavy chain junction region [Macaca mulatta]MOX96514.1 immunoglobulin heavy chain junction region [Macaca mulatta]
CAILDPPISSPASFFTAVW